MNLNETYLIGVKFADFFFVVFELSNKFCELTNKVI